MSKHRWHFESIWIANVNYITGESFKFPIKNNNQHYKTKTGFMNATLFTIKDAHFSAFGQAGFGVKNILLARRNIKYCMKTKMWELI